MRIPFLGVDPTEVGPREYVGERFRAARDWASQPIVAVGLAVALVALIVGAWSADVSVPTIPNWFWVGVFATPFASAAAWIVGARLTSEIYEPESVVISELNVYNGDQKLIQLRPETFSETTVVNHRGEEVGRERLREVMINGTRAYEVDQYDPVLNVATTSWQAHRPNAEIRQDHNTIEEIKTEQDYEIDKAYDLLSHHTGIVREMLSDFSNQMVRVAEDVELPQGEEPGGLHEKMHDRLDDLDPSDELMKDNFDGHDRATSDASSSGSDSVDSDDAVEVELDD